MVRRVDGRRHADARREVEPAETCRRVQASHHVGRDRGQPRGLLGDGVQILELGEVLGLDRAGAHHTRELGA